MTIRLESSSAKVSSNLCSQRREQHFYNARLAALLIIAAFFFFWSVAHGVEFRVAARLTALILSQCAFGALIWQSLSIKRRPPLIEEISVGFVIGSTLSAILNQVLVSWQGRFGALFYFNLVVGGISAWQWIPNSTRNNNIEQAEPYVLLLSAACVALGFGWSHGWFVFAVCMLITAFIIAFKPAIFQTLQGTLVCVGLIGLSSVAIFEFRPSISTSTWQLFQLFTGTDDQIYSEASSNSLVHLGPFDSIFAPGHHVPYHWFTFAWAGNLGHLIGADAFTATLHIATPVGFFFIALLIWSIASDLTGNKIGGFVALLATFGTSSLPTPLRFVNQINTSNTVTHLWVLLAILLLIRLLDGSLRFAGSLLCLCAAIVFLAKVPYGVVLYLGLFAALAMSVFTKKLSATRGALVLLGLIVCGCLSYLIFLSPQPFQDRGFTFLTNSANFGIGTRLYPLVPLVLVSAIAISRFAYVLLSQTIWVRRNLEIATFFLIGTSAGLIRFIVEGSSAENYFLNTGLLIAGLGIGVYWGLAWPRLTSPIRRTVMVLFVLSAIINLGASFVTDIQKQSAPLVLLPVALGVVAVIAVSGAYLVKYRRLSILVFPVLASVLLGSSFGAFLRISRMEPEIEPASVVTDAEIEGLTWLRSMTNFSDLIATNRNLCDIQTPCDYDETRQVVAAFSDRKVFIEGPRFLNGARNYPDWAKDRIRDVLQFAETPSKISLDVLRSSGVDWFYLVKTDPRVAPIRSFAELTTPIVFENSEVAVIDLRTG